MTRRHSWFLAALLAMGGLSGCVVRSQPVGYPTAEYNSGPDYAEVYVAQPPPAPVVEYPTPPPAPGYVWLQGYWDWTGYDWYWVQGYWAPQRAGYVYVAPTYHHQHGRWVYHRSHWVGSDGRPDYVYARPAPASSSRGGSWRAAPAPGQQGGGYPSGGYPSTAPPAAATPGGSWRASPAPAAPVGRSYPAPPASGGGSWRASPTPGSSAPAPAPPPATASPGGGWRASPTPARPTSPTLSTPPGGVEPSPGYRQPPARPGTWTAAPAPAPSTPLPPAGGGYNGPRRIRPVASEPAPSTQGVQPSPPPPRRATPQGQATQGGQSQPQPVQENQRPRRGRPAAAQSVP